MADPTPAGNLAGAADQITICQDVVSPSCPSLSQATVAGVAAEEQQLGQEGPGLTLPTENEFHAEITDRKRTFPPPDCPEQTPPTAMSSLPTPATFSSPPSCPSSSTPSSAISDPRPASVEPQASVSLLPVASDEPSYSETSSQSAHAIHPTYATHATHASSLSGKGQVSSSSSSHSSHGDLDADPPSPTLPSAQPSQTVSNKHIDTSSATTVIAEPLLPNAWQNSTQTGEVPISGWRPWPEGREPTLNVDVSPDSEAPMSSTASVASSFASSSFSSDAATSSSQEDIDGDSTDYDPTPKHHHQERRGSYEHHPHHHHHHHQQHGQRLHGHHHPAQHDVSSAYDADEDFSGSEYSASSCESCSRRYTPSRGNSAEFSDRSELYESHPYQEPPSIKQPKQGQQFQPTTPPTSRPASQAQYNQHSPKSSRSFPASSSSKTGTKSTFGLGSLPSASQASKMVVELVLVSVLMVTIVSAAFTFSYLSTATNHAGQKLREAIEARERSVQRALERVAGEEFVKVRRQQQQRQQHYHNGTTQKQTGKVDDDRLSPAEWQELIHAAVYGLMSKWSGQGLAR